MKISSLIFAAAFAVTGLAFNPVLSGNAHSAPLGQSKAQIAQSVSTDHIYMVARNGRIRTLEQPRGHPTFSGSVRNPNGPDLNGGGGNGGFTKIPNPNRPDFNAGNGKKAGKKWHFHIRVHGGRRSWCHKHWYKVPGMRFHSKVRCDHRHYRAYRSWDFVY